MDLGGDRPGRLSLGALIQRTLASAYQRTNKGLSTLATRLVLVGMEHTPDASLLDPSTFQPVLSQPKRGLDSESSADSEESGIDTCTEDGTCFIEDETFIIHSGEASPLNDSQIVMSLLQRYDQLLTPEDVLNDSKNADDQDAIVPSTPKRKHMNTSLVYSSDIPAAISSPGRIPYKAKFVIPADEDLQSESQLNDSHKNNKSRVALTDISNTVDSPKISEKQRNVKNIKLGRSKSLHEKKHRRNSGIIRRHSFNGMERKKEVLDPWNTTVDGITIACRNVTSLQPSEPPSPWKLNPLKLKKQPETPSLRVHVDESLLSRYAECSSVSMYGHSSFFLGSVLEEDESEAMVLEVELTPPIMNGSPTGSVDSGRGSPESDTCSSTGRGDQGYEDQDAVVPGTHSVSYDIYDDFVVIHTEMQEGPNVSVHEEIKVFDTNVSGLAGIDDSDIKIPDIFVLDSPYTRTEEHKGIANAQIYTSTPTKQQNIQCTRTHSQTPESDLEYVSALGSVESCRPESSSSPASVNVQSQSIQTPDSESRSTGSSQYMSAASKISDASVCSDTRSPPSAMQISNLSESQSQSAHSLLTCDMMSELFASTRDEESMDVDNTLSVAKTPQFAGNCTGSFSVGELKNPPPTNPKVTLPTATAPEDLPDQSEKTSVITRQALDRVVFDNVGEDSISELETGDIAYWMDIKNNNPTTTCSDDAGCLNKNVDNLVPPVPMKHNETHKNELNKLEAMLGALEINRSKNGDDETNDTFDTSVCTLVPGVARCDSPDISDPILAEHIADRSDQATWDAEAIEGFMATSGSDIKQLGIFSPVCHVFLAESSPLNSPTKNVLPPSRWVVVDTPLPQVSTSKPDRNEQHQDSSNFVTPMEISNNDSMIVNKENHIPECQQHHPHSLETLAFNVLVNEGINVGPVEHGRLSVKAELGKLPDIKDYTEEFFKQIDTPAQPVISSSMASLVVDPVSDAEDLQSIDICPDENTDGHNAHPEPDHKVLPMTNGSVATPTTDVTESPVKLVKTEQTAQLSPTKTITSETPLVDDHAETGHNVQQIRTAGDENEELNGQSLSKSPEPIETKLFRSEMVITLNTQKPFDNVSCDKDALISSADGKSRDTVNLSGEYKASISFTDKMADGEANHIGACNPMRTDEQVSSSSHQENALSNMSPDIQLGNPGVTSPTITECTHFTPNNTSLSDCSMLTTITDVTEPSSTSMSSPDQSVSQSHTAEPSHLHHSQDISMDILPLIVHTVQHTHSSENTTCDNSTSDSTHDTTNHQVPMDTKAEGIDDAHAFSTEPVDEPISSLCTEHRGDTIGTANDVTANSTEYIPDTQHDTSAPSVLQDISTTAENICDIRSDDVVDMMRSSCAHDISASEGNLAVSVSKSTVLQTSAASDDCHTGQTDSVSPEGSSAITVVEEETKCDSVDDNGIDTPEEDPSVAAPGDAEMKSNSEEAEAHTEQNNEDLDRSDLRNEINELIDEYMSPAVPRNATGKYTEPIENESKEFEELNLNESLTHCHSSVDDEAKNDEATNEENTVSGDGVVLKIDTRRASVTSEFKFIPKPDSGSCGVAKSTVSASVASLASHKSNHAKRRATKFFRSFCCFGPLAR